MKKHIMVVDDDPCTLETLRKTFQEHEDEWDMTFTSEPEKAWQDLLETAYDAVVTDMKMPGISGLDLLDRMRQHDKTRNIPVVVLTALDDQKLKEETLEHGGSDLMKKPADAGALIARLRSLLQQKSYEDELHERNNQLMEKVRRQALNLAQSRMSIVCRLGMAAEYRDEDTGNHVIRVGCYSRTVGSAMHLPRSFLETLSLAAPLHDIGKIGIPDSILLKPGPLDDAEWAVMEQHCEMGYRILREQSKSMIPLFDWYSSEPYSMQDVLENTDPVLEMAATIALTHHEKWDGTGYPRKLAGEAIPLESRIVAIADVFDALTSNRPYRPARPEEEALTIIESSVGHHFDPRVYAAFMESLSEIRAVRNRFNDDVILFSHPEPVMT